MDDDPKLRALANDLKARGQYDQAAIVNGVLITNSNITAGLSIAILSWLLPEMAMTLGLTSAFAGAMLGSVLGGMRPSGVSSAKVGMLGEGGVAKRQAKRFGKEVEKNVLMLKIPILVSAPVKFTIRIIVEINTCMIRFQSPSLLLLST